MTSQKEWDDAKLAWIRGYIQAVSDAERFLTAHQSGSRDELAPHRSSAEMLRWLHIKLEHAMQVMSDLEAERS